MFKDEIENISPKVIIGEDCRLYRHSDINTLKKFALEHAKERPKKKVVDLSVLIKSGIDCEFSDELGDWPIVRKLKKTCDVYVDSIGVQWNYCQPRTDHIHAWQGGDCPLPEGLEVKPHYRDKDSPKIILSSPLYLDYRWKHNCAGGDIIAFEVIGLSDGYIWPWEVEDN